MFGKLSADEIISLAKVGKCDYLGSLTQSEQLLYLQMINIFDAYKYRKITAEEARIMKIDCVKAFEKYKMFEIIFQNACDIRNRQSHWFIKAEKEGCPICKKLVRIFDGRDKE